MFLVSSAVFSVVLFILVFFYVRPGQILQAAAEINPKNFALLCLFASIFYINGGIKNKVILSAYGFRINFWKIFTYKLIGTAVSFLTPVAEFGGGPLKAYLLKHDKQYRVPMRIGLGTVFVDNFVWLVVDGILTALGLLYLVLHFSLGRRAEFGLSVGIIGFLFLVYFALRHFLKGRKAILGLFHILGLHRLPLIRNVEEPLKNFEKEVVAFFSLHREKLGLLFLLTLVDYSIWVGIIFLISRFMGLYFSFFQIFLVKTLLSLAYTFPVPAGLGISEWIQAGFFPSLGATSAQGLAFSLIFKAQGLFFALGGLAALAFFGARHILEKKD